MRSGTSLLPFGTTLLYACAIVIIIRNCILSYNLLPLRSDRFFRYS
jgi:hypothetical protein